MNKVYHFEASSLISKTLGWVFLICVILFLSFLSSGTSGAIAAAEENGGLWLILALVIVGFGQTFIKLWGHRLEINNNELSLKTMFGTTWAFPVTSIQRIDPKIRSQDRKGSFFTFTTDNKDFLCSYVPKNYKELLEDLKAQNPNLLVQEKVEKPFNILGVDVPSNAPLHHFAEQKLGKNNIFTRALSLSFVSLFIVLLVLAFVFIFAVIIFDSYMNGIG